MIAPSSNRIAAMDVLRGCAVMGILWMNITAFALPETAYTNPSASGPLRASDVIFWIVSFLFFDGKMRALFSMLFGASMLLLIDREEMAGRNGRRTQVMRSVWLLAFGLAHYLLLWWGDILMNYALVGTAALLFVRKEPLSLVKWAFLFFLLHMLLCMAFLGSLYSWGGTAEPTARASFVAFADSFTNPLSPANQAEIAVYRSGFPTIFRHHLSHLGAAWPQSFLFSALDTLGFMLLGMAMLKGRFLTGRWDASQYWRTARHCFLIGLPPMAALATWVIVSGFSALPTLGATMTWAFPFRIPLAVGWAALILWTVVRLGNHRLVNGIAAVGRLALSNYLGTSLFMCSIFYGWGLGCFGHLRPAQLPALVILAWLVMLIWSNLWLNRFAIGPLEWTWRSLMRARPQKIRNSR